MLINFILTKRIYESTFIPFTQLIFILLLLNNPIILLKKQDHGLEYFSCADRAIFTNEFSEWSRMLM